ncbi:sugar ABC transporter substrate-binding protein [Sphaerisporangium aureirubrum]|uniref:Sugar ABC transporter substrate-binding protein n=1 Tax=Sphaerisporangium aureirubrum TaxID=1544736 RepID=A0ABW1NH75_9ACTN
MNARRSRHAELLIELVISLVSGIILAVGAQVLAAAALPGLGRSPLAWVLVGATPAVALLAFFVARRFYRRPAQAFVMISAYTHTRWLADLLENLARSLDHQGIDLVVKLPPYDGSARGQLLQLESILRKRRSYAGGFFVVAHPERIRPELADFCASIGLPVVFVDVPPFRASEEYPERVVFVGCDADEIGERAARWVAGELLDRADGTPVVLAVGGDAQAARHERFAEVLREKVPSVALEVNPRGQFARDRARRIVDWYLTDRQRHGDRVDAIFCTNDEMALGAVDAVQMHTAAGKRHDDLVIIGVDGISEAVAAIDAGATPLRATIVQSPRRIAEEAVDALLRMRAGERVATEILVPTTIHPLQ